MFIHTHCKGIFLYTRGAQGDFFFLLFVSNLLKFQLVKKKTQLFSVQFDDEKKCELKIHFSFLIFLVYIIFYLMRCADVHETFFFFTLEKKNFFLH